MSGTSLMAISDICGWETCGIAKNTSTVTVGSFSRQRNDVKAGGQGAITPMLHLQMFSKRARRPRGIISAALPINSAGQRRFQ
jgi:1,6-anhydro-N-acetylmuramate kinase